MSDSNKPALELGIEFLVETLLFAYSFGAEQMNLPHNFFVGLGCWIIATVVAVRIFWIFPLWASRLSKLEKGLIAFILVAIFVGIFWKPVTTAYAKRNQTDESTKAATIPALKRTDGALGQTRPPTDPTPRSQTSRVIGNPAIRVQGAPGGDIEGNTIDGKDQAIILQNAPNSTVKDNTQISQGAGSALSFNQSGGITAGTIYGIPDRRLSEHQKTNLEACLRANPGQFSVSAASGTAKAYRYAQDWSEVFSAAGWKNENKLPVVNFEVGQGDWSGLRFTVPGTWDEASRKALMKDGSPEKSAVRCLFSIKGLAGGGPISPDPTMLTGRVHITVGDY